MNEIITASSVFTGEQEYSPGWVAVNGEYIVDVGQGPPPQRSDRECDGWLIPGFIDLHVHGGGGASFDGSNPEKVVEFHRAHGTTTMLSSLVSAEISEIKEQIVRLAPLVSSLQIAGIHLEGPLISPARRGAHKLTALQAPTDEVVSELISVGLDQIKMVTLAPELPNALAAIRKFVDEGIVVALGHSEADASTTLQAIEMGASHITHLFNAMPGLSHKNSSLIGEALNNPYVSVEMILDTHHVVKQTAELAMALAGDRWIAVTDATEAAGLADGRYQLGGQPVESKSGVVRLVETGALAGSTLTMDRAFSNIINVWQRSPLTAVRATSTLPAKVLGRADVGVIKKGARADIIHWSQDAVRELMLGGRWC